MNRIVRKNQFVEKNRISPSAWGSGLQVKMFSFLYRLISSLHKAQNTPSRRRRTSGDESRLRGRLTSAASGFKVALTHQHPSLGGQVARPFCAFLVHWFASWTANQNDQMARLTDADSTCRIGRKKADENQLQLTVWNTLRKLSRPTNKNRPTADHRLGVFWALDLNISSGLILIYLIWFFFSKMGSRLHFINHQGAWSPLKIFFIVLLKKKSPASWMLEDEKINSKCSFLAELSL